MQNIVFVNDTGTQIRIDIGVQSSDIQSSKIKCRKPDGTIVEWIATPIVNSTEIFYDVVSGDLDQVGRYKLQPFVILSSGWSGHGPQVELKVKDTF